jgi:hypothetical protein
MDKGTHSDYLLEGITKYEEGNMSSEDLVKFFQFLVDEGHAWKLQGSLYGSVAMDLIEGGLVSPTTLP